jgi:hypothetical protein
LRGDVVCAAPGGGNGYHLLVDGHRGSATACFGASSPISMGLPFCQMTAY